MSTSLEINGKRIGAESNPIFEIYKNLDKVISLLGQKFQTGYSDTLSLDEDSKKAAHVIFEGLYAFTLSNINVSELKKDPLFSLLCAQTGLNSESVISLSTGPFSKRAISFFENLVRDFLKSSPSSFLNIRGVREMLVGLLFEEWKKSSRPDIQKSSFLDFSKKSPFQLGLDYYLKIGWFTENQIKLFFENALAFESSSYSRSLGVEKIAEQPREISKD